MNRSAGIAWPPLTPMVKKIAIINGAVWLGAVFLVVWFNEGAAQWLWRAGRLHTHPDAAGGVFSGAIWQPFTYMWMHDLESVWHIAFNLLVLWMFGASLETRWGGRAFLRFYVLSGVIAGGVASLAGLAAPGLLGYPIIGASGAVMATLSATSVVYPNRTILLAFVIPVQCRYLAPMAAGMDVLLFLTNPRGFAVAAHLGGLLAGYLLVTGMWRPSRLVARARRAVARRRLRALRSSSPGSAAGGDRWLH